VGRRPGSEAGSDATSFANRKSTKNSTNSKTRQGKVKEPPIDKGVNTDAEIFWRKVHTGMLDGMLPRNAAPLDWLLDSKPDLFESNQAEVFIMPGSSQKSPRGTGGLAGDRTSVPGQHQSPAGGQSAYQRQLARDLSELEERKCEQCGKKPSPSGWGYPSCPKCNGVEAQCFPFEHHIFCGLIDTAERMKEELKDIELEEDIKVRSRTATEHDKEGDSKDGGDASPHYSSRRSSRLFS